jgi:hypothetical protein
MTADAAGRPNKITRGTFHSADLKVKWADQHIRNMEKILRDIHEASARTIFANNNTEPVGVELSIDFAPILAHQHVMHMMTGDAVHNLRSALDHLAWGIVSAFKDPDPKLYFPIDVELKSLIGKRSFREIQSVAPDVADLIVNEIKPYGAGNPFFKLSRLDRADKHRLLLVRTLSGRFRVYASEDDDYVPEEAADSFILVASPTRVPKPGSRAAIHNENYRGAAFDIHFGSGLPFENEPVIPTLHQLTQLVTGVIQTFVRHIETRDAKIA